MAKTILSFAIAFLALMTVFASAAEAGSKRETHNQNSTISTAALDSDETVETAAEPKDEPEITKNVGCKKFFPSVGMTLTVPCGAEVQPAAPAPQASTVSPVNNRSTAVDRKAKADAECVRLNGNDHYAANITSQGSFDCYAGRAAADAECVQLNGPGTHAGKQQSDGTYTCIPGSKAARTAICRRKYGRRSRAGKLNRDGRTWTCYGPKRRISRRRRRRRRR